MYTIRGYNGPLPKDIKKQIASVSTQIVGSEEWLFDGPIEKLLKAVNRQAIIDPVNQWIYFTQYNSFSSR